MGLNCKRGRIPNYIKQAAKEAVDESGHMAYHYACYNCSFNGDKMCVDFDYPLIDCIVKEMIARGIR